MSSIAKSEFQAALGRLEAMAKGGNVSKAQGATQLYHTPGDSDPGSHAGTSTSDYQEEHTDGINDNGTDYDGVKKALAAKVEKSQALTPAEVAIVKGQDPRGLIAQKVASGHRLTPAESWITKGGYKAMTKSAGSILPEGEDDDANSVPETNAGEAMDGSEIEADAKKSLGGAVATHPNLSKGLEMSPILAEFAHAMGTALQGTEARTVQAIHKSLAPVVERVAHLEAALAKSVAESGEFYKGFAETLVGIGQHVAGSSDVAAAQAHQAASAPKSQLRAVQGGQGVQAVQKSFGPGGLETGGDAMNKSNAVSIMTEMVQKGQLNSLDVCKFEMTGEISPQVKQMVLAHAKGN